MKSLKPEGDEGSSPRLEAGDVHLWSGRLEGDVEGAAAIVSEAERIRAGRYATRELSSRFLLGRAILRRLLGGYLGRDPSRVEIEESAEGKPETEGIAFNLSHTGDWLALAFCAHAAVGVDIECARVVDARAIARRYFGADEWRALEGEGDYLRAFLEMWTAKEAALKAAGLGLASGLSRVRVARRPLRICALGETDVSSWQIVGFQPSARCVAAAVCTAPVRRWRQMPLPAAAGGQ